MTDYRLARAGAYYAALHASADVADRWVQTDNQAQNKMEPGWYGWRHNLAHVGTYVATQGLAVAATAAATGDRPSAGRLAAALAVSGVTHAVIDRRWPPHTVARWLGKAGHPEAYWERGGAEPLDQAAHAALSVWLPALILTGDDS